MYESQFEQELYELRREKLRQIAALGQKAGLTYAAATYPNCYRATHTVADLLPLGKHPGGSEKSAEELATEHIDASIAGRIMAIRLQGKAGFAQLQQNGQRIQIYVRKDDVGEDAFALYKLLDLGDHIGVTGYLMRTRTGELTIHVQTLTFLAKAMLALPDKFHGLEDTELRYRQRYVDLFVNTGHSPKPGIPQNDVAKQNDAAGQNDAVILSAAKDPCIFPDVPPASPDPEPLNVREVFVKRAAILRAMRRFFDSRGYLEVETPMMHTIAGGAAARPFTTHHNALDLDLKLRIAPELYLKRLVVGGLDRVYEINRNFRNEGISTQHNPEFTMLEFYQAYSNYHDLMDLTQELITTVATEVNGTPITHFNGTEIDLSKWTKLSMRAAIREFVKIELGIEADQNAFDSVPTFLTFLQLAAGSARLWPHANPESFQTQRGRDDTRRKRQIYSGIAGFEDIPGIHKRLASSGNLGKAIAETFELLAEPHLIQPTIIYDYPLAVSPLSKIKPDEPDWVERFEFYIGGFEVGNAFSELNDPDDQRARFEAQLEERKRGDVEAMAEVDEDYIRALGYGLPPTAGEGIGIDRLTMILTGSKSIRDVILFPLLRPQTKPANTADNTTQPPQT